MVVYSFFLFFVQSDSCGTRKSKQLMSLGIRQGMNGKRFSRLFVFMDESSQFTKEVTDFMTVMDELSFYLNRFCPVLKLLSPTQKQKECAQTRISERYV